MKKYTKQQIALVIALAFHISGFIAIALFKSPLFISLTPLNLLVCAALIFYTQEKIKAPFLWFCLLAFTIGFATECIGVNTGILFGDYSYGKVLGPLFKGVPLIIGVQWMVTMYCIGVSMKMLETRLLSRQPVGYSKFPKWWMTLSVIGDGALVAVFFDWVLEPVAIRLGYWQWQNGVIPWSNYYSWWGVSAGILAWFYFIPFSKQNMFAVHLLLIQFMFFLLLKTFM